MITNMSMYELGLKPRQNELNYFDDIILVLKKIAMYSTIYNKHAAALIKNEKHISSGFNKFIKEVTIRKDNITQTHFKTLHAEVDALYSFHGKKNVKGMDIIVIRVNKNNILKNSRPCNDCINKLNKLGIRKVYYSNEQGEIVYEYVKDMPNLHISSGSKLNHTFDSRILNQKQCNKAF
jgi:deoxycytidylate deaminase